MFWSVTDRITNILKQTEYGFCQEYVRVHSEVMLYLLQVGCKVMATCYYNVILSPISHQEQALTAVVDMKSFMLLSARETMSSSTLPKGSNVVSFSVREYNP